MIDTSQYKGTKKVEIPFFVERIKQDDKILVVGECVGNDGISKAIFDIGCKDVTTIDIRDVGKDSWLVKNTKWKHIKDDYLSHDTDETYDSIISISVFEHFGLFWDDKPMYESIDEQSDVIHWNHDLKAIKKTCELLKNKESKSLITLPIGNFMNYNEKGFPILRYYDEYRRKLISDIIEQSNCYISEEIFYFSKNFDDWYSTTSEIGEIKYLSQQNPFTPNIIWAFTIQKR